MSPSCKSLPFVSLFFGVLFVCTGLKSEAQNSYTVDTEYQQQALKERKKLSKKAFRQYLADPELDKRATNVLYKLYQMPSKGQSLFVVHGSNNFKQSKTYRKVGDAYMSLSLAEGPVLKNHVAEVTGRRQLLNGIEMTHALDEHWSLFCNESVPSGPDINEKYYAYLITCVKTAYAKDGSIPVITYHMANPYSPLPPQRYGAYQEYKDKVHRNVIGEMRKRIGDKCGYKYEYNTPRDFLDAKLDAFAEFLIKLKDSKGNPIPCIIRPFHEMDMNSFWWGMDYCSAEDYIWLFQYTVDRVSKKVETHNLIWGYSLGNKFSTHEAMMERYPGDDYVDIIGGDEYNLGLSVAATRDSYTRCQLITKESLLRHKVCGLFECGMTEEKSKNTSFYIESLPTLMKSDGILLSFVMGYMAMPTNEEGELNMRSFARSREMIKRW